MTYFMHVCVCECVFVVFSHSAVSDSFVTPWTVACQAPLSVEFARQEYWNALPLLPLGDLPNPGVGPTSPVSLALADRFFTTAPPGKPQLILH